jgi:hypothetical protein
MSNGSTSTYLGRYEVRRSWALISEARRGDMSWDSAQFLAI